MIGLLGCRPEESTLTIIVPQDEAQLDRSVPTLADFWDGSAEFILEVAETGLPMGESETLMMDNGHLWSYVHASDRSAGVIDRCGDPVEFPGCTVIYRSFDGGMSFSHESPPICQFECNQCPCSSETDHIDQQQYPSISYSGVDNQLHMVYEYRGSTKYRSSPDGLRWSDPLPVADTGHWRQSLKPCPDNQRIGSHPFVPFDYECLSGAPPGIHVEGNEVFVFVAMGESPGNMGCYRGFVGQSAEKFEPCNTPILFSGAQEYGPIEDRGRSTHAFWDFRYISSAEIYPIGEGENRRYYMLFEGIRGPGPFDAGDTQFGVGMARSITNQLDGPWEKFSGNPILVDSPANIGIGHSDLIVIDGETILYTSLDGVTRSRLRLVWRDTAPQ